jgi:hypothetical protein
VHQTLHQQSAAPHAAPHPCAASCVRKPESMSKHAASSGCPAAVSSAGVTQQLMSPLYDGSCHSPPELLLPMPGLRPCLDSQASTAADRACARVLAGSTRGILPWLLCWSSTSDACSRPT